MAHLQGLGLFRTSSPVKCILNRPFLEKVPDEGLKALIAFISIHVRYCPFFVLFSLVTSTLGLLNIYLLPLPSPKRKLWKETFKKEAQK